MNAIQIVITKMLWKGHQFLLGRLLLLPLGHFQRERVPHYGL